MAAATGPLLLACWVAAAAAAASAAAAAAPMAAAAAGRVEVYGFSVATGRAAAAASRGYDWGVLTTVAWRTDPELVQLARQRGAAVEASAGDVSRVMLRPPAGRRAWVRSKVVEVVKLGASGVNFDLEVPLEAGSAGARAYASLVNETAAALRAALPGASVSVDVPWSPHDVDGRNYDWAALAAAADLLFVMAYDTQSQILGRCIASANSPIDTVARGLRQWLALGVPPSKLVLGLPWYGYDYQCEGGGQQGRRQQQQQHDHQGAPEGAEDLCAIRPVPFRNVSCSDAAGAQRCYSEVMALLAAARNTTPVKRDATQGSPYFNYLAGDGSLHQVWFDDPASLAAKYALAVQAGLRGIGFWNLDCLDYESSDPVVLGQTGAMWEAVEEAVAAFGRRRRRRRARRGGGGGAQWR